MLRFLLLPVVLVVLLGMVHVLPDRGQVAESAIRMDLPLKFDGWEGVKIAESEAERTILAKDTEFAKVVYGRPREGSVMPGGYGDFDRVFLSVVLSGYDINNSIHRPERCLPAQGYVIYGKSDIDIKLSNGRSLPVRRLESQQKVRLREGSDEIIMVDSLVYYFFVGHDRVTNEHYERTLFDMRDRLLYGRDQRWAYVIVSTSRGKTPWSSRSISGAEADELLKNFSARIAEDIIDWDAVRK